MKIAVTDACIFIDIIELDLASHFFKLPFEVHTSYDVIGELNEIQQQLLKAFETGRKLQIHNLTSGEHQTIANTKFPKSLSPNDKTVIFLAKKLNAVLLSSDKAVRNYAKTISIEYHGMLWIFDKLLEHELLSNSDGIIKINEMVQKNIIYRNNKELLDEMERRINLWSK